MVPGDGWGLAHATEMMVWLDGCSGESAGSLIFSGCGRLGCGGLLRAPAAGQTTGLGCLRPPPLTFRQMCQTPPLSLWGSPKPFSQAWRVQRGLENPAGTGLHTCSNPGQATWPLYDSALSEPRFPCLRKGTMTSILQFKS